MDNEVRNPTISHVAYSCLDLFGKCLARANAFNKNIAEDLHTRFALWAAYTGAFAPPGTALDDRLIFHDDVKRMVIKLLFMVERNLKSGMPLDLAVCYGSSPSGTSIIESDAALLPESQECRSITTEGLPYGSLRGLRAVSAALDRLHRLATAIRRSSIESQRDKLLTKPASFDSDGYLQECVYRLLRDRFPNARAGLIEQLTSALSFHRKRLLYTPRHNRKLALQQRSGSRIDPVHPTSLLQQALAHSSLEHQPADQRRDPGVAATAALSRTDASIPDSQIRRAVLRASMPAPSVVSIASAIDGDHFQYPDPPLFEKEAKIQPCPYCAEPLSTTMLRRERLDFWR